MSEKQSLYALSELRRISIHDIIETSSHSHNMKIVAQRIIWVGVDHPECDNVLVPQQQSTWYNTEDDVNVEDETEDDENEEDDNKEKKKIFGSVGLNIYSFVTRGSEVPGVRGTRGKPGVKQPW